LLERWLQLSQQACPVKLTILLDAPAEWCVERLSRHGLASPDRGELERAESLREALAEQTREPNCGPVLELDGRCPADALEEAAAAVLAMN
jgi:thymidylate kinase